MLTRLTPEDKWCVYKTTHPLGFYYWGKGVTKAVLKGSYKGSGAKLRAAWELGGYPKSEWSSEVFFTFPAEPLDEKGKDPGEAKAYAKEKEVITWEMIGDPFCLNDCAGGKGGWKWQRLTIGQLNRRKKRVREAMNRPETKAKHQTACKKARGTPEARVKQSASVAAGWNTRRANGNDKQHPNNKAVLSKVSSARWAKQREERSARILENLVWKKNGTLNKRATSALCGLEVAFIVAYLKEHGV